MTVARLRWCLIFEAESLCPALAVRLKRALKSLLRQHGLRC